MRDPFVKSFWINEYENYDKCFMREAIAPIQNKIGQFLTAPAIRNILGQVKSKINFRFLIDNHRIFIANLSKGALGEDKANLLGSLLVTQLQLAALSRTDIPEEERKNFFLVIDEFQSLTTDSFASILSEARKYRLSIVIRNQYLDQLQPHIRQAILGNVGTIVSFCIGNTDAEILKKEFGRSYSAEQFTDLKRYEIIVKLLEDGAHLEPFRGKTLPKMGTPSFRREILIEQSRQRYSSKKKSSKAKLPNGCETHPHSFKKFVCRTGRQTTILRMPSIRTPGLNVPLMRKISELHNAISISFVTSSDTVFSTQNRWQLL